MDSRVVGKCGACGGVVTVPNVWMGIYPPVPQCNSCHRVADQTAKMPIVPMQPKKSFSAVRKNRGSSPFLSCGRTVRKSR